MQILTPNNYPRYLNLLFQFETGTVPKRENYIKINLTKTTIVKLGKKLGLAVLAFSWTYNTNTTVKMQEYNREPVVMTPSLDDVVAEYRPPQPLTFDEQAQQLNEQFGYGLTGKDLVLYTRAVFSEAGNDPKAKTKEDLRKGWEAVAQVILNRYLFDKNNDTRKFSKANTLEGVITAENEFHGVRDSPSLFSNRSFYDSEGDLRISPTNNSEQKLSDIYDAVVQVLKREGEDITNGAVYFHTDWVVKGRKAGQRSFSVDGKRCVIREPIQYNTHLFFSTTCPVEPEDAIAQDDSPEETYFN
ncbi:cell wall hydrolase [Candidatus Woesearchaeota archaeon]|nr:cell wall hydrolase [Candidatus Woesearchaeota archaeon]